MCYNILRVSTFPTEEKPGMGLHSSKLCGIDEFYTFYLSPKEDSKRLFVAENTTLFEKEFFQKIRPKGIPFIEKIIFHLQRLFSLLFFSFNGFRLFFTKKIDIVHIHSPMYILIALLGYMLNKKIYITFHGTDFHRIKDVKWYRVFSKIFNKVFIISPDMKDDLIKIHGKEKIIQVQNGIDLDVYKNNKSKRKKQIVAVGSLKEEKGFVFLIEAFSNLIKKHKGFNDYSLIIAGEGLLRDQLELQIKDNKMQNYIRLIGHQNRENIIKLYNESEVFVLSSISEGFPKVLLESISCGCKVVATNVGSVSEVLKDSGYKVVEPNSSELLKNAILKTLTDNIEYKNGFILNKYTWDAVKLIYKDLYKRELNV